MNTASKKSVLNRFVFQMNLRRKKSSLPMQARVFR